MPDSAEYESGFFIGLFLGDFIMAEIRTVEQIAKKWADVTPMRSGDYEAGIKNPRRSWSAGAAAASDAYKAGVTRAVAEDRFAKGVKRAGDARWAKGAIEKGTMRWGPGVALAEDDYRTGFAPYQAAIAAVKLPPRYAKRDPRNLARVKAIVDALVAKKEALLKSA